ncbi:hypothetical protein AN944_02420 [Shewanella sp. P1-14-1]|nr:hypothetical protein AN944_02420 [Shewanella sp. P1-14-1]
MRKSQGIKSTLPDKICAGPVDLSRLFLQQLVGNLYKAATLMCGYST